MTQTTNLQTTRTAVDRLNKSLGKSSLRDLAKAARRSMLLADCSGSMDDPIRAGGRKIDALRTVVAGLRDTHPVPVAAFGLDSVPGSVRLLDEGQQLPEPSGLTPLHRAIDFGRAQGASHLVVVTDGQPDSEDAAFAAADLFGGPIDVFYVGDGDDRGARFAQLLAQRTGGTANLADLGKPKELKAGIAGLLGDGSGL
jgi:hypothetical protein